MKTSNMILLVFAAVVFSVPFIMLSGFQAAIRKQKFTVNYGDAEGPTGIQQGRINPYKVIKITGADMPGIFSCEIFSGEEASFMYSKNSEANVAVEHRGDTLLIRYANKAGTSFSNRNDQGAYYINQGITLFLPVIPKLMIERTDVKIVSVDTAKNQRISIDLSGQSNIQLFQFDQYRTMLTGPDSGTIQPEAPYKISGLLNNVEINAVNSNVVVGRFARIKDLRLQMENTSNLSIEGYSRVDQISGFVSDNSTVQANWKTLRRIAALTGK